MERLIAYEIKARRFTLARFILPVSWRAASHWRDPLFALYQPCAFAAHLLRISYVARLRR
jgi:hypothetical protein